MTKQKKMKKERHLLKKQRQRQKRDHRWKRYKVFILQQPNDWSVHAYVQDNVKFCLLEAVKWLRNIFVVAVVNSTTNIYFVNPPKTLNYAMSLISNARLQSIKLQCDIYKSFAFGTTRGGNKPKHFFHHFLIWARL